MLIAFIGRELQVERLLDLFRSIRKVSKNDNFECVGKENFKRDLRFFIDKEEPVKFILPAFPCKSPNTSKKVLGFLPDKGESVALENIKSFCDRIKQIYSKGCEFVIFSDGRVYGDIVGVSDRIINKYGSALKNLIKSKNIRFTCLDNFFEENDPDEIRRLLLKRFGSTLEETHRLVKEQSDKNILYRGFTRFLMDDGNWPSSKTKSSIKKECEKRALKMINRNIALSNLISFFFGSHIRLSIHPNSGEDKFGINLVSDSNGWGTPWHNVLVLKKDGSHILVKKSEAEKMNLKLVFDREKPSHFFEQ